MYAVYFFLSVMEVPLSSVMEVFYALILSYLKWSFGNRWVTVHPGQVALSITGPGRHTGQTTM